MTATGRLTALAGGAFAAALLLAQPAAAFTFEDGKGNAIPKFDLEEQTRQFRKSDSAAADAAKRSIDTPVGKLQFGFTERERSMYGSAFRSPFSPFGSPSGNADRRHYERLFAPDSMKDLY